MFLHELFWSDLPGSSRKLRGPRTELAVVLFLSLTALSSNAQTIEATIQANDGIPVLNPITNKIYINYQIIDGATNLSELSQGLGACCNPIVNLLTNKLYVSNIDAQTIQVADLNTNTVTDTISVGFEPLGLAVNQATDKIYAVGLSEYAYETTGMIMVIDGATNATTTLSVGSQLSAVAINPVTNKIYIGDQFTGNVVVLDGATNATTIVDTGFTLPYPQSGGFYPSLAVNPVSNKVYVVVSNDEGDYNPYMVVIDGPTNSTTKVNMSGHYLYPTGVVVNPVSNKIYLICDPDTLVPGSPLVAVTIVDGATNAILGTVTPNDNLDQIDFGGFQVAVNPVTNMAYLLYPSLSVSGYYFESLAALDGVTDKLTGDVTFKYGPGLLVLNAATDKVYVYKGNTESGEILSVIDGATNRELSISAGTSPVAVAVNPVTGRVYTADYSSGTVQVTGGSSNTALATVPVGIHPVALAVNPVTNRIYVASAGGNTITAIDGETNKATTLAAGSGPSSQFAPESVAVNPVTNTIYLANYASNTVSVINGTTKAVTATVKTGSGPYAVAVNSTTNKIYVANINNSSVTVIDGATNTTSTVTTTGSGPISLAVDAAANKIYVANGSANSVTVIDGATNATSNVAVGISPYAVGVDPVAHTVYVANYGGKSVTVIDGPTLAATTVATSSEPNAVAVNPVTHMAYVSNITGGSVTAINGAITSAAAVAEQGGQTYYTQRIYAPAAPGAAFPAPYAVAVNPATDKVYAADKNGGLFIVDVDRNTTVPLKAVATGVTDASTVSTTNVFQTRNPAPSFTVNVTSDFTSTPAYSGVASATNPPPSAVYYKVDGGSQWSLATMTSAAGANPASFSIGLSNQQVGPHTLYVTPAYGNMGLSLPPISISSSTESPEVGNMTAYAFQIDPPV